MFKRTSSQKESAPKVSVPKTKAGVIQAAVDMLKAARKEDAQKMFAKFPRSLIVDDFDFLSCSYPALLLRAVSRGNLPAVVVPLICRAT